MREAMRRARAEADAQYGPNGGQGSEQGQPATGARINSVDCSRYDDCRHNHERGRSTERGNRGNYFRQAPFAQPRPG